MTISFWVSLKIAFISNTRSIFLRITQFVYVLRESRQRPPPRAIMDAPTRVKTLAQNTNITLIIPLSLPLRVRNTYEQTLNSWIITLEATKRV